jgi:uncharacterized protein (DUF1800 family)
MASPTMTRSDVCRLLGRVAFGATAADIDEWTGKPYADLVDRLLLVPAAPVGADDSSRPPANPTGVAVVSLGGSEPGDDSRLWWLERMRSTKLPLVERMTLFWHGHFATAIRWPLTPSELQVMNQVQTLRTLALGSFRQMVEAMTVDAAMLYWLSGNDNRTPHPNENYARELFELFTLGKRPQVYTEKDIREAARALTGWSVVAGSELVPAFQPGTHDAGTKKILGQTVADAGAQEFTKVVDIALAQPVAPYFLAFKMVQEFAYVPPSRNLLKVKDPLVTKVATTLRSSDWDIAKAMRTLMLADEFRFASPLKRQQRVRQPVELAVAACKALGVNADNSQLLEPLQRMGQRLLAPPNVGGWPVGTGWLSPVTTLGRYDLALEVRAAFNLLNPASFLTTVSLLNTYPQPDDLDGWAKTFGLAELSAATAGAIKGYLSARHKDSVADRQAGVVALILSSPEWVVM